MQTALIAFLAVAEFQLGNGLRVVLHEDHRSPEVLVNLSYGVGSRDEAAGETGVAHLFEHLMFMGTARNPNGRFDAIMEAEGGSNNASTHEDRTSYHERGPSGLLEMFLGLEADRMATLADGLTPAKVALQREVVKNERRQSYEDEPYGEAELALPGMLFPAGHPYAHPVIGSAADLDRATVESLRAFFRRHYAPNNCVLVIDGDFDSKVARATIERLFGKLPGGAVRARVAPPMPKLESDRTQRLVDRVVLEQLELAWRAPGWLDDDGAAAEVLAVMLAGNKSSRLYRALAETQGLASSVEAEIEERDGAGVLSLRARALPGRTAGALAAAIDVELAALAKSAPSEAEVARAVAFVETRTLKLLDDKQERAAALAALALARGSTAGAEDLFLGQLRRVDAKQIVRVAARVFAEPRVRLIVSPKEAR